MSTNNGAYDPIPVEEYRSPTWEQDYLDQLEATAKAEKQKLWTTVALFVGVAFLYDSMVKK